MTRYTKIEDETGGYSGTKIACVFSPIPFVILVLILFFIYHDVSKVLSGFLFVILALVILIPFLILPVSNFALLLFIDKFYVFILDFSNIEGDAFTYFMIWAIALTYISLNAIIFTASIISLFALMTGKGEGFAQHFKRISATSQYEKPEVNTLIVIFLIIGILVFVLLLSALAILLIT